MVRKIETSIRNVSNFRKMDKRMAKIQIFVSGIEDAENRIRKEKVKQSAIEKNDVSSTITKNIKGLKSKFMDNPKSEHGKRPHKLSKIIENALDTNEDEDEIETSVFEGLSNELDKQMKKLKNLNKNDQREENEKDEDATTSDSKVEDSSTAVEDSQKKHSKVVVRRLKIGDEEESEKENEMDEEFKQKTKKMEEEVRKKLKAIGLDSSDKIKIKVITKKSDIDKYQNGENLLSSEQADDIKDLFLNILQGGGEEKKNEEKRQKTLQESYNQNWDEYDEEEKEVEEL